MIKATFRVLERLIWVLNTSYRHHVLYIHSFIDSWMIQATVWLKLWFSFFSFCAFRFDFVFSASVFMTRADNLMAQQQSRQQHLRQWQHLQQAAASPATWTMKWQPTHNRKPFWPLATAASRIARLSIVAFCIVVFSTGLEQLQQQQQLVTGRNVVVAVVFWQQLIGIKIYNAAIINGLLICHKISLLATFN